MASAANNETRRLLESYRQERDARVREQIVARFTPLVRRLCSRFRSSGESREDLFQVGVIGLLCAIEKYDPGRGASFPSLAIPEVKGAVLNFLRDHGNLIKIPRTMRRNRIIVERVSEGLTHLLGRWPSSAEIALASGLAEAEVNASMVLARTREPRSLDAALGTDDGSETSLSDFIGHQDDRLGRSLDRITLAAALTALPPRERTIVRLRFYEEMSQRQIADQVGVSQMHVSRLLRSALIQLRHSIQDGIPRRTGKGNLSLSASGPTDAALAS